MDPETCDVLVVGAGPAGSTAAFILAGRGLRVALLDRCDFPRPKPCGGLLTRKTVQGLERIFRFGPAALAAAGLIRREARQYTVAGRGAPPLTRRLDDPFYLIDRATYDDLWLHRAVAAGAEFHPRAAVASWDPDRFEAATVDGRRWRARIVVGADGVDSRIRHALVAAGRLRPARRRGRALALECRVPRRPGAFPDHPAIYFGHVARGYAWSFPGSSLQVLGIASLEADGRRLRRAFREFLGGLGLPDAGRLRLRGHGLPYGGYLVSPGYRRVLLVGDAAGLADPFLGEGIYYAHRSAELAARAAVESWRRPDSALDAYRGLFRRDLLPEMRYAWAGRQVLFALPPGWYHPLLRLFLRLAPKTAEQTIQGRRSFRWFRLKKPCPR